MSRAPLLKGIMLPALVQHTKAARSGYVKADGIALLLAFLRSCANKVCYPSCQALQNQPADYLPLCAHLIGVDTVASSARFLYTASFCKCCCCLLESSVHSYFGDCISSYTTCQLAVWAVKKELVITAARLELCAQLLSLFPPLCPLCLLHAHFMLYYQVGSVNWALGPATIFVCHVAGSTERHFCGRCLQESCASDC